MTHKLVVLDMDNTLSESRTPIDWEMRELLTKLLGVTKVAIASGGTFSQFETQVLSQLPDSAKIQSLYLLVTSGAKLFVNKNGNWELEYSMLLSNQEKESIWRALQKVLGIPMEEVKKLAEDRKGEITYSALGKDAPIGEKVVWDPDRKKRTKLVEKLIPLLPGISPEIAGTTSIDFTKRGIDKAYGIERLMGVANVSPQEIIYIGDAIFPKGNDEAVLRLPIEVQSTSGPEETKAIIRKLLGISEY